eukprot:268407_1
MASTSTKVIDADSRDKMVTCVRALLSPQTSARVFPEDCRNTFVEMLGGKKEAVEDEEPVDQSSSQTIYPNIAAVQQQPMYQQQFMETSELLVGEKRLRVEGESGEAAQENKSSAVANNAGGVTQVGEIGEQVLKKRRSKESVCYR